jgi:hypothetical protein
VDDPVVNVDVTEITRAVEEEEEASSGGSFRLLFQNNKQRFLYRTLLGMGGQLMQQISGINLITYVCTSRLEILVEVFLLTLFQYATVIFEQSVGMSHHTALLLAGFNGIAYFFSSLVPIWTIERYVESKSGLVVC